MSRADKERFKECLDNLSWRNVTNNNNVDEAFDLFWNDKKKFSPLSKSLLCPPGNITVQITWYILNNCYIIPLRKLCSWAV